MALLELVLIALLLLVPVTVGMAALYLTAKRNRFSHLPGPPLSSFWFGHVPAIREAAAAGRPFYNECFDKYGPVYILWILHFEAIQVCDVTAARSLLQDPELIMKHPHTYNSTSYVFGNRFVGNGLLTQLDHRKWEDRYKLLSHAFRRQSIVHLLSEFNDMVDGFLDYLGCVSLSGENIAMRELFPLLAMDVLAKVAFGLETNAMEGTTPFRKALEDVLTGMMKYFRNPLSIYLPSYRDCRRRVREGCGLLRGVGRKCIMKRQKEVLDGGDYGEDILGLILKSAADDRNVTVHDLVDEFMTFFFAGHDTAGITMAFALQDILVNAEIKTKVVEEVDNVLTENGRVTAAHLSSLPLLSCVLKETLRCHPPAIAVTRSPSSDITVCGNRIPMGSCMRINIDVIHHRQDYWEDPFQFNPYRFLAPATKGPLPYLPFSSGPHICLGRQFAEIETKLVLARLLYTFDIDLVEGQDTSGADILILQRPRSHVYCRIKSRGRDTELHEKDRKL